MADRVAQLNAYMDVAVAAVAAGNYSTAISNALAAQGILSTLPKLSRSSGTGGGTQSAEWDGQAIDAFVKRLRQQYGASLGVQTASVVFVEASPVAADQGFLQPEGMTQ